MELNSQTKRLGETALIACIVIGFTGWWANGIAHTKDDAYQSYKRAQVATIAGALQRHYVDNGAYPQIQGGGRFCEPFNVVNGSRCLGELVGPYLTANAVTYDKNQYVYFNQSRQVFVAADIKVDAEVATSNRCMVGTRAFWCIKLQK